MSLVITNIKTDKETYILGKDSYINFSFDILSEDKDITLNSLSVNYGFEIFNGFWVLMDYNIDTILLSDTLYLQQGMRKTYTFRIPTLYPNTDSNITWWVEISIRRDTNIRNYVEIRSDIKMRFRNHHHRYYPDIRLDMKRNNNQEIRQFWTHNQDISEDTLLSDNTQDDTIAINYWYLGIFWNVTDLIGKEFYEYLMKQYRTFRISRFFTLRNSTMLAVFLSTCLTYILFSAWESFTDIYKIVWVFIVLYSMVIIFFKSHVVEKIKNDIVQIRFQDKKYLLEKMKSKSLKLRDIFESINIHYTWNYKYLLSVDLCCTLLLHRREWRGRSSRRVTYMCDIFRINMWSYYWPQLSIDKLQESDEIHQLYNIDIKPWVLVHNKLKSEKIEIVYKLSYGAFSQEIIDDYREIILR